MNTAKAGRVPQQGLVVIAHSRRQINAVPVIKALENDGLELVCLKNNSTTLAMVSSEGESYSKSRLNSIEQQLYREGFEDVTIEHCVEVRIHLRGLASEMADSIAAGEKIDR